MALVALPIPLLWPSPTELYHYSATMDIIDAANETAGLVFQAPAAGSLTDIGFGLKDVTTGATVDVRLETVDAVTTGDATGTLFGAGSNASKIIAGTDDNKWMTATLTTAPTVAIGDLMAIQIVNPAASFGNITFFGMIPVRQTLASPYVDSFLNAAWVKRTRGGSYAVKIGGTWYNVGGFAPWTLVEVQAIQTTGSAEVGNRFSPPFNCECNGFEIAALNWTDDTKATLYSSDGTTILGQSATWDKDTKSDTSQMLRIFNFAPVILSAGSAYYACFNNLGSTVLNAQGQSTNVAANLTGLASGETGLYKVLRTTAGSGAFTETTNARMTIMLCLSKIDNGAGGGGLLVHPGMTGGLHG